MPKQVIMPQLGESVIEGTLTKWLKAKGDHVEEYEPLLEINTDKVDTEVPSPAAGVILDILIPEGTVVRAGSVLAWIGEAGENTGISKPSPVLEAQTAGPEPTSMTMSTHYSMKGSQAATSSSSAMVRDLGFISPVVRRIAQENGLDLSQVSGSGLGGRITKQDVLDYLGGQRGEQTTRQPGDQAIGQPGIQAGIPAAANIDSRQSSLAAYLPFPLPGDEIIPLTPVRRSIADHMVFSEHTSPQVTTVMEADMSRIVAHRKANKDAFARDGINLTYTAYFVAAAAGSLIAYPIVNSSWSEKSVIIHHMVNIGIATSLGEAGLIVPVIHGAEGLSLFGIARAVNDLAERARKRQLKPDEVKGGTFTITNHGITGSLFAAPIINQPQCAILGVGAIQKRVVVVSDAAGNDALAIRPMVYLSLTFDHRILDGASADIFLSKVVKSLTDNSLTNNLST